MKTKLPLSFAVAALAFLQPTPLPAQNIPPTAGPAPSLQQQKPDGFIMVGGKTYIVRQGVAMPLDQELILRVTPSGVIGFDGRPRTITSNAMMTSDGQIVALPRGIVFSQQRPAIVDTNVAIAGDPRLQDRGVYGQNVSGLAPAARATAKGTTSASSGPRNIIAKKKTVVKSQKKAVPALTAKRATAKSVAAPLPAFNDDVMPLPNHTFNDQGAVTGNIDAGTTMLSMTTLPPEPFTAEPAPEVPSISASLGFGINAGDDFTIATPPPASTPLPPTLAPIPSLTLPTVPPLMVQPAP
jgi:hypothetical protein